MEFGPTKNVALLMAVENRQPQPTPALRGVEKLLKPGDGTCWVSTVGAGGDPYITIEFGCGGNLIMSSFFGENG